MDHRYGERRPVDLGVLIRKRCWRGWVIGRIRNLSISGAYVELPRDTLSVLSQVRLELEVDRVDHWRLVHCNAMVVRVERGGVALALEDMAPGSLNRWWADAGTRMPRSNSGPWTDTLPSFAPRG